MANSTPRPPHHSARYGILRSCSDLLIKSSSGSRFTRLDGIVGEVTCRTHRLWYVSIDTRVKGIKRVVHARYIHLTEKIEGFCEEFDIDSR